MPSPSHPQAQFVPIPPDLDLSALVENTTNFDYVTRLPKEMLQEHSAQSLEKLVLLHVVIGGKPLVIEGWERMLDSGLFSPTWLRENYGTKAEIVRDIPHATNIPMSMGHYLKSMDQLTRQFNKDNFRDPKRQRLYLKDIDCPEEWHEQLKSILPESLFYLNDCIESRTGGAGATLEPNKFGQMGFGKGVAPAGDLMSSLPEEMRALNMQCYIGHEGTYTPTHREMCASLGHNIMVETSTDHRGEKAGSSIWFMTETKEREVVSEYFLSMLGHDIEVEKHFAQINAWKKAPFNVWVVEQKVGDLILIPPLAPHQVWNRGTRTMKSAWNRTTIDTLELAIHEALPRARMVCRDEQYKNKAIIYYTLENYYALLQRDAVEQKMWRFGRIKQVVDDFRRLFALFSEILISESFLPALRGKEEVEFLPYDSNVTCSYCRCNIFNRFLTCKSCIEYGEAGAEDTYDVCMECYAMGRSCACISNLHWVEQWQWSELLESYEDWRSLVIEADGYHGEKESPLPLDEARERYGKKPVAQIVHEQLKIRPWHDIRKALEPTPEPTDSETDFDDGGKPKKRKGRKSKQSKLQKKTHTCHVCMHHEWNWKLAFCTTCPKAYCYGVLFRAFDQMPQAVMENENWQCPECLGICSCGKCRRGKKQKAYAPKGTLLGHDTRAVADFRSVESLVDFSRTNLAWLRQEGDENPQESSRMKRLREKAEAEKEREREENERRENSDEGFIEGQGSGHASLAAAFDPDGSIDPSLLQNVNNSIQAEPSRQAAEGKDGKDVVLSFGLHHLRDFVGSEECPSPHVAANHDYQEEAGRSPQGSTPVAPILSSATSYPDPTHFGQNRMMGIGYYQQGDGIDKILYDAPNSTIPHQKPAAFDTNLLDPSLKNTDIDTTMKRKRQGLNDVSSLEEGISNTALYKKQKRREENDTDLNQSISNNRPARKSAVKVQTFINIDDEEAIQGDVDAHIFNNRLLVQPETAEDDFEIAKQAMMQFKKTPAAEKTRLKKKEEAPIRKSFRRQHPKSPSLSLPTEKPPRRSAWLKRKEAVEQGLKNAKDVPQRGRGYPRSTLVKNRPVPEAAHISLGSERSDDDSLQEFEDDNRYDRALNYGRTTRGRGRPSVGRSRPNRGGKLNWRQSRINPDAQVAQTEDSNESLEDTIIVKIPPLSKPLPAAGVKMSLREKMALRGKSIKIVGSRSQSRPARKESSATPISSVHIHNRLPQTSPQITPSDHVSRASSTWNEPRIIGLQDAPIEHTDTPESVALECLDVQAAQRVYDDLQTASRNTQSATLTVEPYPSTPAVLTQQHSNGASTTVISKEYRHHETGFSRSESITSYMLPAKPPLPNISAVSRAPESAGKKGPTIVRLGNSESGEESMSPTADESFSDESIPAMRTSQVRMQKSHRTRVSARGSGRGRGRGRVFT